MKDVRNHSRLEKIRKEGIHTTIKGIRNLFRLERENEGIKDRTVRDELHINLSVDFQSNK